MPKTMEMDETTKKNIYEILEQAKVLEELMKEVELPLSKQQVSNLKIEDYHINKALCWVDCICNVISRIDSALHHPEEYLEPDPIPPYDGEAEAVYARYVPSEMIGKVFIILTQPIREPDSFSLPADILPSGQARCSNIRNISLRNIILCLHSSGLEACRWWI